MSRISIMCAECAREFDHELGPGRRPLRCPKCRNDKAKRDAEPKPKKSSRGTPMGFSHVNKRFPLVDQAVVDEMDAQDSAYDLRTPPWKDGSAVAVAQPLDLPQLARAIRSEIAVLEDRLTVLRALDQQLTALA
jgi:hypothetical protein